MTVSILSPWQCVCLMLLGAIFAVWMDEGNNQRIANYEQELSAKNAAACNATTSVTTTASTTASTTTTSPLVKQDDIVFDAAKDAALEWKKTIVASQGKPLSYLRNPQGFIAAIQDCTLDPHCHVMYHHVSKTGGTTLEQALFPVFGQDVQHTCCHQRLRQQFMQNPHQTCNLKFASFQMFDDEFLEVVSTCQRRDPNRRTILLTSFREPTRTLLSYIHQMCNKLLHKRTERLREACAACIYENSTDVWHTMAFIIQRQIEGAYRVSTCLQQPAKDDDKDEYYLHHNETTVTVRVHTPHEHAVQNFTLDKTGLRVLTLETNDVDDFLWHWQPDSVFGVANPEQAGDCYFRLTTELIKELRPALAVYRKLLLAGL